MQINNTISFLHRVNEETDAYNDDNKEEWEETEHQDAIPLSCCFQMIALLILTENQSGFTTVLFGIVMSKVHAMHENFNKATRCQKSI